MVFPIPAPKHYGQYLTAKPTGDLEWMDPTNSQAKPEKGSQLSLH